MWPSELAFAPDGGALYFVARTPETDAAREAAWRAGGVRELASRAVEALTPEHLHVEDFAVGPAGEVALITAATSRDYDASFMARVQPPVARTSPRSPRTARWPGRAAGAASWSISGGSVARTAPPATSWPGGTSAYRASPGAGAICGCGSTTGRAPDC
jgi:hypothetical protein